MESRYSWRGGAVNQLRIKHYFTGRRSFATQSIDHQFGCFCSEIVDRLAHNSNRGRRHGCPVRIVERNQRYIVWDAKPQLTVNLDTSRAMILSDAMIAVGRCADCSISLTMRCVFSGVTAPTWTHFSMPIKPAWQQTAR